MVRGDERIARVTEWICMDQGRADQPWASGKARIGVKIQVFDWGREDVDGCVLHADNYFNGGRGYRVDGETDRRTSIPSSWTEKRCVEVNRPLRLWEVGHDFVHNMGPRVRIETSLSNRVLLTGSGRYEPPSEDAVWILFSSDTPEPGSVAPWSVSAVSY